MISIQLKDSSDKFAITIPKEIIKFIREASIAASKGKIKSVDYIRSFGDYGKLEIQENDLDHLYSDITSLELNIDEIIKEVHLPKMVGGEDKFLYIGYKTPMDFDNFVELGDGGGKYFNKKDMLYLISLIKNKIIEAKQSNIPLLFSGD